MRLMSSDRQCWRLQACLYLAAGFLMTLAIFSTQASAAARRASMVIDANTGKVLHAAQEDELRHPASLTKMMTLYLLFEELEAGRVTLDTAIRVSERAASAPPSKLGLRPGEEISVRDAIRALVTKSANDVAVAVAEHIGGTEEAFARTMTEKARLLGMSNTTFRNASGLPNIEQVTTARDMLTLALHHYDDFPKYYPFFATKTFTYKGRTYRNHNSLLSTFPGMEGMKTGYIRMSGFNVVSAVRRGGRHVVAVVFGGTTAASRNAEMRALLNRTLPKASTTKTRKPAPVSFYRATPPVRAARRAPGTQPAVAAQPLVAASPPSPARATEVAAAPQPIPSTPAISIAKVRHVAVAPMATRTQEAAVPAVTRATDAPPSSQPSGQGPVTLGLGPSTLQQQAENLSRGQAPVARIALAAADQGSRGSQPQPLMTMAALQVSPPPSPEPARSGSLARPNASAGGYQIQVGAYGSATEAEKALAAALERASGVLAKAAPVTLPVQSGARQLYRARFAGFDSQAAQSACQELRRHQIQCFVTKAE